MKVRVLDTFETKDEVLMDTMRRMKIMQRIPDFETEFRILYGDLLTVLRKACETNNIVIPVEVEDYDGLLLLELDKEYDGLNYKVNINSEDYDNELVELYL